jgi:hypothetical protein
MPHESTGQVTEKELRGYSGEKLKLLWKWLQLLSKTRSEIKKEARERLLTLQSGRARVEAVSLWEGDFIP